MKLCDKISQVVGGAAIDIDSIICTGHIVLNLSELTDNCIDIEIKGIPVTIQVIPNENNFYNTSLRTDAKDVSYISINNAIHYKNGAIEFDFCIRNFTC